MLARGLGEPAVVQRPDAGAGERVEHRADPFLADRSPRPRSS